MASALSNHVSEIAGKARHEPPHRCRFSLFAAYARAADLGVSELSHDRCTTFCLTERFIS